MQQKGIVQILLVVIFILLALAGAIYIGTIKDQPEWIKPPQSQTNK